LEQLTLVGTRRKFEYIKKTAAEQIAAGSPVISVDTRKKEIIGNFKNNGQEYRKKGDPRKVLDHDFPIEKLGKIAPYGVYNVNNNVGFVNVGTNHDTSEFAVESNRTGGKRWGNIHIRKQKFSTLQQIVAAVTTAEIRMWKYQLQQFLTRTVLEVRVSHFPPGTSKWNKVEHRLFC